MATRDTSDQGRPNRNASEPLNRAQDEAQNLGHRAAQSGRDALQAGREQMNEHMGVAQHRIRSLLEQQSHRAADQLGGVAQALHAAAERLNEENNGTAARYAGQAAQRIDDVAEMLRHSTVDDMVAQVEGFARRQPEVFIGGAFALGFLFARFIKSSGDRQRHGQMMARQRAAGTSTAYDFSQERSTIGGSYPAGGRATGTGGTGMGGPGMGGTGMGGPGTGDFGGRTRTAGPSGVGGRAGAGSTSGIGGTSGAGNAGGMGNAGASGTGAASSTAAAGTRNAAELMAGGSPEPTKTGSNTGTGSNANTGANAGAGKPDTQHPGVTKAVNVPDETLTSTSATGSKPQETMP